MDIRVFDTKEEMGQAAAVVAAERLRSAIASQGHARFIAATGASQFEFLAALVEQPDIDWAKTEMFHLDEYIGLDTTHPASFVGYLRERFTSRIPIAKVNWIDGVAADIEGERRRLGALISSAPIDVAFVGIGENGHLAFNDPPADFETSEPYLIVNLDDACRRQQLGEGWFPTFDDVPTQAVSMSIRQIMTARSIICTVPDRRKAVAVRDCLGGGVSSEHPASILLEHQDTAVFLDSGASSLLQG